MSVFAQFEYSGRLIRSTCSGSGHVQEIGEPSKHHTKYIDLLKKVTFPSFDVKEWIIENDLLVHNLMENKDAHGETVSNALEKFEYLLERVQGIPPEVSCICYELAIAYNVSFLKLRRQNNNLPVGGHHRSATILHRSLLRALEALRVDCPLQKGLEEDNNLFSASNIDQTLKQWLPSLLQAFCDNNIGCAALILNCSLLAFLWLVDECVKRDKAIELLSLIQNHVKKLAGSAEFSSTEKVPPEGCPVHLFSLGDISSLSSCIATSSTADVTDAQNLLSVVTTLLAFSNFANQDYTKVLTTLQDKVEGIDVCFSDIYLKGYVLYVQNEVDRALPLFQQCVHMSVQGQQKAASLIMVGCCFAVKGKHHTAVAKFKQAMEHTFQQLEALLNTCLQYQKLGNTEAEIQGLKLLKQASSIKEENKQCYSATLFPSDPSLHVSYNLELLTVPPQFCFSEGILETRIKPELVTYILAKRSAELGRFEDAANNYLELLAYIVENCSSVAPAMATIASATELYRQCAVTLLKAERYQDTLTVCDKLLTTSDWRLNKSKQGMQGSISRAAKKRHRSDEDDAKPVSSNEEIAVCCEMSLLKAKALIHLHQPVEAMQDLNRVLRALDSVQSSVYCSTHQAGQESSVAQQRKRRKLETDEASTLLGEEEKENEPNKLVKIKVQAYKQKASILEGLGQTHDALHQLHLGLECLEDDPGTVYEHTKLLFKLGSEKDAVTNWLEFRGIKHLYSKEDPDCIKRMLSSSMVRRDDNEDVSVEKVQEMDQQIVHWCSKSDAC